MSRPSTERQRHRYKPDKIRVLFIGESPPAGGTFFYRANSKLYRATRAAFEQAIPAIAECESFLDVFMQLGCYLEDLSPVPVNHLNLGITEERRERRRLRRPGIEPLARRMKPWAPNVVAVVMKDIARDTSKALAQAGHAGVERVELPFPARHYDRYVSELAAHVHRWQERDILAPLQAR